MVVALVSGLPAWGSPARRPHYQRGPSRAVPRTIASNARIVARSPAVPGQAGEREPGEPPPRGKEAPLGRYYGFPRPSV